MPTARRALIAESDRATRLMLTRHLMSEGFDIGESCDGLEALEHLTTRRFDLIVLDSELPGLDGIALCRAIRQGSVNPDSAIFIVAAPTAEADKVLALVNGADDYLTRPLSIREFLARVAAIMRRVARRCERAAQNPIERADLRLDPARRQVLIRGRAIACSKQEFELLYALASSPGIVFSREQLLARYWPASAASPLRHGGPGVERSPPRPCGHRSQNTTFAVIAIVAVPHVTRAQELSAPRAPQSICNLPIPPPAQEPAAGTPPVIFQIVPCFESQGNVSIVEPETYLHYIQTPVSRPSRSEWIPYDDGAVESIKQDFARLWATGFLDDLTVEAIDCPFTNGTMGKLIVYRMEERQRIKIVNYQGSKQDQSKFEEKLRELDLMLRIDTFVDQARIRRVETVIVDMLGALGFPNADVTSELKPLPGEPRLTHLIFTLAEGPETRIRGDVDLRVRRQRRHKLSADDRFQGRTVGNSKSSLRTLCLCSPSPSMPRRTSWPGCKYTGFGF